MLHAPDIAQGCFAGSADSGEAIETGADAPPEEEFPTEDLVLEGGGLDDDAGEGAHAEEVWASRSQGFVAKHALQQLKESYATNLNIACISGVFTAGG